MQAVNVVCNPWEVVLHVCNLVLRPLLFSSHPPRITTRSASLQRSISSALSARSSEGFLSCPSRSFNMASYTNGTNDASATKDNGVVTEKAPSSTSSSSADDSGEKLASHAKPKPTVYKAKPTKATREGVESAFEQYGQVIRATFQPGPHQGGVGTTGKKWGKLLDDLKGLRGAGKATTSNTVLWRRANMAWQT